MDLNAGFLRNDLIDFILLLGTFSFLCLLNMFLKIGFFCVEKLNPQLKSNREGFNLNNLFW